MPTSKPKFTVEIVSRGEPTTLESLQSACSQTGVSFEVIVVIAGSKAGNHVDSSYKTICVPEEAGLLSSRYAGHQSASGDFAVLLDSTRLLLPGALATVASLMSNYDMLILPEESVGEGYWASLAALDKQIVCSESNLKRSLAGRTGFLLPRVFESSLLTETFRDLRLGLGAERFDHVIHGDHHLLFEWGLRRSQRVGIAAGPLIRHYADQTLRDVVRKYYRYGKSDRSLRASGRIRKIAGLRLRSRSLQGVSLSEALKVQPLYIARALAFGLGVLSGP